MVMKEVVCPKCRGAQVVDLRCFHCNGCGEVFDGDKLCQCEECCGDGILEDQCCPKCGGDGFIEIDYD